jgi:hypothetical protein
MKIRAKLALLVFGTVFTCLIGAGAYYFAVAPMPTVRREMRTYATLSLAEAELRIQANRLGSALINSQKKVFAETVESRDNAFAGPKGIVTLGRMDRSLAKALDIMTSLQRK